MIPESAASGTVDQGTSMGMGIFTGRIAAAIGAGLTVLLFSVTAWAGMGQPSPKQMTMQEAATPVATEIHRFHDLVNLIIIAIAIFVLILLAIVIFRFNEKSNPEPSRVTHNTLLEVVWTVVPIIILVVIAIPSFKLLYLQYSYPKPDVTIKAVGNTWYWEHQYPDHGNFSVTSTIVRDGDLLLKKLGQEEFDKRYASLEGSERERRLHGDAAALWKEFGQPRLLAVDNDIAVPVGKVVHVLVTSNDVIHNWTIPSFGSKVDAVPGRITATWFKAEKEGVFYGQCSELCGKDHAFMPIAVRVVSQQVFDQWVAAHKGGEAGKAQGILLKAAKDAGLKQQLADAGSRAQ
jgi:cytochrome c oxidase subunit 2